MLDASNFLPAAEAKEIVARHDRLEPLEETPAHGHGPARYFRLQKIGAVVGFIGAMSDAHFCERCNKVRLTADGKIRPCLGHHEEHDLKPALRPVIDAEQLEKRFRSALVGKPPEHLFRDNYQPGRVMTAIGG
jgi:cyclic pyranopterin phosphate synthase